MKLVMGSRGADVRKLQRMLMLVQDGSFGPLTREAVITWQREHDMTDDGIVTDEVWQSMCAEPYPSCRRIDEIIVHCAATAEGKDFKASDIKRWHTTPVAKGGRGWTDIGYHYVIRLNGTIEKGRDEDLIGAHCLNHNSHSIGICYVGGCAKDGKTPKDTRTLSQKTALLRLLKILRNWYPNARIYGHRDFARKACPSFDAKNEYRGI